MYWVGFNLIGGIGRVRMGQLESHFGDLEKAWKASQAELKHAGLDTGAVRAITSWRPKVSLEAEMEKLKSYSVKVVTYHDEGYPARLKEIYDYPPLLYIRGELLPEDEWCLGDSVCSGTEQDHHRQRSGQGN
jgi:DNA processing protein